MLSAFVVLVFKEIFTTKNALLIGVTLYCLIQGMVNPVLFYPGLGMFALTLALMSAGLAKPADREQFEI